MSPQSITPENCTYPNFFSSVVTPAVEKRLPTPGSYSAQAIDYISGVGPFFQTVSKDLCDDNRMGVESAKSATSFITRSATSAVVIGGTAALAGIGLVVGSPLAAIGAGLLGLAVLPPLAERAAFGIANFASDILRGIRGEE